MTNKIGKLYLKSKNSIAYYFHLITNIPSRLKDYYHDTKYKLTHLEDTNLKLGLEHLYKGNLNDALLRFNMVDKFFSKSNTTKGTTVNYYIGLVYFLKNNYPKAIEYIKKSPEDNKVQMLKFLENAHNIQEIPQDIWKQSRNLIASYYHTLFRNKNNINLPYYFIYHTIKQIDKLPDHYSILDLGSNVGLLGHEVHKRFPEEFTLIGVENSKIMNDISSNYWQNNNIYDQIYDTSILEFLKQTADKFDVILSFCSLSFTADPKEYLDIIYKLLNEKGYFSLCLPIGSNTKFIPKRKEFIFNINQIRTLLIKTNFDILNIEESILSDDNKYGIIVVKKNIKKNE